MNRKLWRVFAGLCAIAMSAVCISSAHAQMSEVKEKPRMYSYVSFWNIPRAQWSEMAKADAADQKILDKAIASGTIVGYGNDVNLVHQPDGSTHDDWWWRCPWPDCSACWTSSTSPAVLALRFGKCHETLG